MKQWLTGNKAPAKYQKSVNLAQTAGIASQLDGFKKKFVIVLPTDSAWKKKGALYKKLLNDNQMAESLILQAVIEVQALPKSFNDIGKITEEDGTLTNLAGAYFIVDKKNQVYFAKQNGGEFVSTGKPLQIDKNNPITLDDAIIFGLKSIPKEMSA